ncbi:MAG: hypothetical protein K2Q12_00220, partial [Rickettsiales bacterium]|nr:hypothetical protein [Rickettsiales bacterium]
MSNETVSQTAPRPTAPRPEAAARLTAAVVDHCPAVNAAALQARQNSAWRDQRVESWETEGARNIAAAAPAFEAVSAALAEVGYFQP